MYRRLALLNFKDFQSRVGENKTSNNRDLGKVHITWDIFFFCLFIYYGQQPFGTL